MMIKGQHTKLRPEHMVHMCIPERFWDVKLDDIRHPGGQFAVRTYLRELETNIEAGLGLMLWGANGIGKTSAAVVIAKEVRKRGATVFFVTVASLRQSFLDKEKFDPETLVIDRAEDVDLLILDDLGKEASGDSANHERFMEKLFRERSSDKCSTIVTTNMNQGQMEERYKRSMMEVIKESIGGVRFNEGENRRDEAAQRIRKKFGSE